MNKLLKEARLLLLDVRRNVTMPDRNEARIDKFLKATAQTATPKSKGGRLRREKKRTAEKDETKAIREAVFRRAEDQCEAWLALGGFWKRCGKPAVSMDHWLGGSGRRRWGQTVDTCWALCGDHDRERTHNIPTAEHWNAIHRLHCQRHDYFFVPHITHAQLKRSAP